MKNNKSQFLLAVYFLISGEALAVDGVAVEAGSGEGTTMVRIAVQWDWDKRWLKGETWHLGGYWDLGLGRWWRDALPGQNDEITEIGLTPVFRFQQNDLKGAYVEGAVGFHLLSETRIDDKSFSTSFQFGDQIGIGYRFGVKGAWDVAYHFQHLSNGGIKNPNNGINFNQIRLQYHLK